MERSKEALGNAQGRASAVVSHLLPSKDGKEFDERSLFNYSRWGRPLSLLDKIVLAVYAPFGAVLSVVRFILFLTIMSSGGFLPHKIARRLIPAIVQVLLGLIINVKNKHRFKNPAPVVVGNHITDYDTYIIPMMINDIRPVISARVQSLPVVGPLLKFAYSPWDTLWVPVKVEGQDLRMKVRNDIESHLKGGHALPIGILPEGGLTNGKVGTMVFKKFVFGLGLAVTPISIKHSSPLPINTDWLGTQWIYNLLWQMFVPWHVYDVTVLPEMAIKEGEDDLQFAKRVQTVVSENLGLIATDFPYERKVVVRSQTYNTWKKN